MGLAEVYFAMALLVGLAVPVLWPLLPVVGLMWVLLPAAERVSNDVRDTSALGSIAALIAGVVTIGGAGVVVVLALLAVGMAGGVL